jgi:hypothetical protein
MTTREFLKKNWLPVVLFSAIVALFVFPIALHTAVDYPGEIGKYWEYSVQRHHKHNTFQDTRRYLLTAFTSSADLSRHSKYAMLLTICCVGAFFATWPRVVDRQRWRFTLQIGAACVLAALLTYYYGCCGIDDIKNLNYTGVFFGSVMLVLVSAAAMNAAVKLIQYRRAVVICASVCATIGGVSAVLGNFANPYRTNDRAIGAIRGIQSTMTKDEVPIVLSVNHDWGALAAVIIDMERRHQRVFVADRFNDVRFMWTADYSSGWEGLANVRYIDLADFGEKLDPGARVLFENDCVSVREFEGHYRVGSIIGFAGCRDAKAFKSYGWWDVQEDRTWTYGKESMLVLNPDRMLKRDGILTVTAIPFVTDRNPQLDVDVIVNGKLVGHWKYSLGDDFVERETVIPKEVLAKQSPIQVVFRFPNAKSPAEVLPPSTDRNQLALGVKSVRLCEKPD